MLLTLISLKGTDLAIKAQDFVMATIGLSLVSLLDSHDRWREAEVVASAPGFESALVPTAPTETPRPGRDA